MSIYCQIPPYPDSDVFTHIETIWEVSRTKDFLEEDIVDTTFTNGDKLNSFISSLSVPKDTTWYVRATRRFSEERSDEVLEPIEVMNYNEVYNNNIIHSEPVYVEKPFIYVNRDEFNDQNFIDFEIRTSEFRCKQDGHYATHWIITDIEDNVLFSYLNATSKEDRNFIRVNKTTDLINKSVFFIHAIHVSTNGIESEKATYVFNNNNFNFDIIGITENILPGDDIIFTISPASARDSFVNSIYLKVPNGNGQITKGIDVTPSPGDNIIRIPGKELHYDSEYYLDVYCYNNHNEYTTRRLYLKTRKSDYANLYNPNFRYKKELSTYPKGILSGFNTCTNYTTFELPNRTILIPKLNSDRLTKYKAIYTSDANGVKVELDLGNNSNGLGVLDNVQLPSTVSNDILIKMINGDMLLIDSVKPHTDGTNRPVFQVYSYNRIDDMFTLLHEDTVREKERFSLGRNNSIFQYSTSHLIYLDNGTGDIRAYDFIENKRYLVLEPEESIKDNIKNGCMFYNRKKGIAIIIGTNGSLYNYDPEANTLIESTDVPFEDWIGSIFKSVELPNGDHIIITLGSFDPVNMSNAIVYYDSLNNVYSKIDYSESSPNVNLIGTISGFSTSLFLHSRDTGPNSDANLLARLY